MKELGEVVIVIEQMMIGDVWWGVLRSSAVCIMVGLF